MLAVQHRMQELVPDATISREVPYRLFDVNRPRQARRAGELQEGFAQGLPFNIRWRLHWFTDLKPLRGYPPFEKMLQPQG